MTFLSKYSHHHFYQNILTTSGRIDELPGTRNAQNAQKSQTAQKCQGPKQKKANHLGSPIMSHEPEEEAGTHINPHGPQWGSNQRRLDGEDGTHTTRVQGRLPDKAQLGRVEFE